MPCTIGLRPKHSITPSTEPTRSFVGRSGSHCGKEFATTNASQLLSFTAPTILMVHILLMLSSLPIPTRSRVRDELQNHNGKPNKRNLLPPAECWHRIVRATDGHAYEQTIHRNFGRSSLRPLNPNNIVHEPCVLPYQNAWEAGGGRIPHLRHSKAGFSPTLSLHLAS